MQLLRMLYSFETVGNTRLKLACELASIDLVRRKHRSMTFRSLSQPRSNILSRWLEEEEEEAADDERQ